MRGADTFTESLFTMRKLEDFVPARHPLREIRKTANTARIPHRDKAGDPTARQSQGACVYPGFQQPAKPLLRFDVGVLPDLDVAPVGLGTRDRRRFLQEVANRIELHGPNPVNTMEFVDGDWEVVVWLMDDDRPDLLRAVQDGIDQQIVNLRAKVTIEFAARHHLHRGRGAFRTELLLEQRPNRSAAREQLAGG